MLQVLLRRMLLKSEGESFHHFLPCTHPEPVHRIEGDLTPASRESAGFELKKENFPQGSRRTALSYNETRTQRIFIRYHQIRYTRHVGSPGNFGQDRGVSSHPGTFFYFSNEPCTDYAFTFEFINGRHIACRVQYRHPAAGSRTAGSSVEQVVLRDHDIPCFQSICILEQRHSQHTFD